MHFDFLHKVCLKKNIILLRIPGDIIITIHRSSCAVPLFLLGFNKTNFLDRYTKHTQKSNFVELLYEDRQTRQSLQSLFVILERHPIKKVNHQWLQPNGRQ